MNTKLDGISSELVAVGWSVLNGEHTPLARLSDAETIINDLQNLVIAENQRKQQLEEERDTWKERAEFSYAQRDKQAERIKELEAELQDMWHKEVADLQKSLSKNARISQQSAALKLAKDAFSAINIEAKTFMSYENARDNFIDDTYERKAYERAMVNASELTKQALAAIDSLKGE